MIADVREKVCLITGASRGLGKELAIRLAKEGAKLIINYNESQKEAYSLLRYLKTKYSADCIILKADITKEEQVKGLYEKAITYFGKLDVLINNAGILSDGMVSSMNYEEWNRVLGVNLSGMFLCSKFFNNNIKRNSGGKIINIGSVKGITGSENQCNYAASKAAVIGFTKSLAKELGSVNISVNCVCPNFIETDLNRNVSYKLENAKRQNVLPLSFALDDFLNFMVYIISDCFNGISGQVFILDSRI